MKIVQVHNYYRYYGGECAIFEKTVSLLRGKGHEVFIFTRNSKDVGNKYEKIIAGLQSFFSVPTLREFKQFLGTVQPDIVHIHNLYPLITPSVLTVCKKMNIPVVMTCHNYRLICPIGICFNRGENCNLCQGGREYHCFFKNCRNSLLESLSYTLRNVIARIFGLYLKNVNYFISISGHLQNYLLQNGFSDENSVVVPNPVTLTDYIPTDMHGTYVGYVGRVTPEKGVSHLVEMARMLPNIPVLIAGDTCNSLEFKLPDNIQFLGFLPPKEIKQFYQNARIIVVPSIWQEPFGLVAVEAMSHGVPVVAFQSGALSEIVKDFQTGRLCTPSDTKDLACTVADLWAQPSLCKRMGENARKRVEDLYSDKSYIEKLLAVYQKLIVE